MIIAFSLFPFFTTASVKGDAVLGEKAPNFSLSDLSGRKTSLGEHVGQVVIIDFWASWCMPCRSAIPELVDLKKKYGHKGLRILGINLDTGERAGNKSLLSFKKKYKINYPVLRHNEKVVHDYFDKRSPMIPTAFLVDREGKIKDIVLGYRPGELEKSLKDLLN